MDVAVAGSAVGRVGGGAGAVDFVIAGFPVSLVAASAFTCAPVDGSGFGGFGVGGSAVTGAGLGASTFAGTPGGPFTAAGGPASACGRIADVRVGGATAGDGAVTAGGAVDGGDAVMGGVVAVEPGAPGAVAGVPVVVFGAAGAGDVVAGFTVAGGLLKFGRGMSSAGGSQYLVQPYQPSAATATNASSLPRPERPLPRRAGE